MTKDELIAELVGALECVDHVLNRPEGFDGATLATLTKQTREVIAFAKASAAGDGWLPIESVPRDGTKVDLYKVGWGRYCDCSWIKWSEDRARIHPSFHFGWMYHNGGRCFELDCPTHWRPLPSPPSQQETG